MNRRAFLGASGLAAMAGGLGALQQAAPPQNPFESEIIPSPDDPALWPAHRDALTRWREEVKARLRYDDALYRREDFAWVTSSFACCFVMLCDEGFYNRARTRWEVESWVEEGKREFGGYDSVVLWHAYPRIGIDERNQFDFYRDQPGGLAGLREVTQRFQSRGVKVYVNYNPWDTGTRREGRGDIEALVWLVEALGCDGIFLDTMRQGADEFRAKLDGVRGGVVLEGEIATPLDAVHNHHFSWGQGFQDSRVPGVLRNKWVERRHMQHQIRRWHHDHSGELQIAWMNGSGIMVWENVFGSWVGWNQRDRSMLRSMLPVQRRYHRLFCGEGWTPLVPTEMADVYATEWSDGKMRLWTLVNRSEQAREGRLLTVPAAGGARYFDLIGGKELPGGGSGVSLIGWIGPRGIAGFLAAPDAALGAGFAEFLAGQAATGARADFRTYFPARYAVLKPPPGRAARRGGAPAGMVAIGPAEFQMKVVYRVRETGFYTPQDYVVERGHAFHNTLSEVTRPVSLGRYAIDLTPVTNAQFYEFVRRSRYQPQHTHHWLREWQSGRPPAGREDHPVVWVSLEDARAYAAWAGKRLPTEEEWQFAAQGPAGLLYPWGPEMKPGVCNGGESGGTTPVRAFPGGRSPFGCYDLCGNTWEWTESERTDGRTRFCILKGGSYYRAQGSLWYMDGGPQAANFGAKFLLSWPGLDRCATIGFRCAVDLE